MLLRSHPTRRVAVVLAALAALLPSPWRAGSAAAASGIELSGRGWGHGRGLGQYGALGYAVDKGQSTGAILDHFYGNTTAGSQSPDLPMTVRLVGQDNKPTIVVQERGHLRTSVDGQQHNGIKIERTAAGKFVVSDGNYCGGPWTPRPAVVSASSIEVSPTVVNDDRTEMLQLCVDGGTRWLRGSIRAVDTSEGQRTVNALSTDNYLRGVVPRESPASWGDLGGGKGMEALKAQAVAARSYATAENRYSYAKTCDTTACQVYSGRAQQINGFADLEDPRTDAAVARTAGQVRMLNGAVARTEFSSSTGGYTAGGTFPAVPDDGDAISLNPNHVWTTSISAATLEGRYNRGTFRSATVLSRNGLGADGGRVVSMRLFFSGGSVDVSGNDFQAAFGLKSNWFTVSTDGPTFAPFEKLGGSMKSAPNAASWAPGRLDIFTQGGDNALWHKWYDRGWSDWQSLGGGLTAAPAVASPANGVLDVFVRGSDQALWHMRYDGSWHPWEHLGGVLNEAPTATAVGGRVYVFGRGADNGVWYRQFNNGWSNWAPVGGTVTSSPTAASWPDGRVFVFARGGDNGLWMAQLSGGAWGAWQPLGGGLTAAPGAAGWGTDRLDVVVRGTDNAMWHKFFDGASWSGWSFRGGAMSAAPSLSTWGPKRLDVQIRGADNALWHTWSEG